MSKKVVDVIIPLPIINNRWVKVWRWLWTLDFKENRFNIRVFIHCCFITAYLEVDRNNWTHPVIAKWKAILHIHHLKWKYPTTVYLQCLLCITSTPIAHLLLLTLVSQLWRQVDYPWEAFILIPWCRIISIYDFKTSDLLTLLFIKRTGRSSYHYSCTRLYICWFFSFLLSLAKIIYLLYNICLHI